MSEPLLEAKGICKSFPGVRALHHVNFNLRAGEVHVLAGENGAGKSTLIKLLSGAYPVDQGQYWIAGKEVRIASVQDARRYGIATIYQEMNLVPELTAAQNIFLGSEIRRPGLLKFLADQKAMASRSRELLGSLGVDVPLEVPTGTLSVPQRQMVEIAKALSAESRIIIFDEPTATLAEREVRALFDTVRLLKDRGMGIIYISHRLEEIWEIGDRVTVLRDGMWVGTAAVQELTIDDLIRMMIGREIGNWYPKRSTRRGGLALEMLGVKRGGTLQDIDLRVCEGEIVGLAGLVGSGRTEVAEAIFGVQPIDGGTIRLFGRSVKLRSPIEAAKEGVALLTEDRKQLGLFQILSVKENIVHVALKRLFPRGIVRTAVENRTAGEYVKKLGIKTPGLMRRVQYLSGGNQQKVVLAKWLASGARILILDEPTRGVDVGAKQEIHRLMAEIAESGLPILMISSEIPELLGMCDRIYVMREGRVVGELDRETASQEAVLRLAVGEDDESRSR